MKEKLLGIVLLLILPFSISMASIENCRSNLLIDYAGDSQSYKIADESLINEFSIDQQLYAVEAVKRLSNVLSDKSGLVCDFDISRVSCKEIVSGIPSSMVCYIESEVGFFIVSKDMLSGVNIIFNRWD